MLAPKSSILTMPGHSLTHTKSHWPPFPGGQCDFCITSNRSELFEELDQRLLIAWTQGTEPPDDLAGVTTVSLR